MNVVTHRRPFLAFALSMATTGIAHAQTAPHIAGVEVLDASNSLDPIVAQWMSDGSVSMWRQSSSATGTWSAYPSPMTGVRQIVGSYEHACALHVDGTVWCWGSNARGNLGSGRVTNTYRNEPIAVPGVSSVVEIASQSEHTCARRNDGTVICWGGLGRGRTSIVPTVVAGLVGAAQIAMGALSSCALTSSGSVMCWGSNDWNELGTSGSHGSARPVAVPGISDATALTMSRHSACVIRRDGSVWCWGSAYGAAPTRITAVNHATEIHCSGSYSDQGEASVVEIDNILCVARQADGEYVSWSTSASAIPGEAPAMEFERDTASRAWPHVTLQRSDEYDEEHVRCYFSDTALRCGDRALVRPAANAGSASPPPASSAPSTQCVVAARANFHLRPAVVRASIGIEYPAQSRVQIVSSESLTRGATRLYGVRVLGDGAPENAPRGFMFLAADEVPAGCPMTR